MSDTGEPLDTSDIEKIIAAEMTASWDYVYGADNIASERDRNYDYYCGIMNDLPAATGRSKVIEPTVANYIGLMKPNLLRIFTAGRTIAEYSCPKPELQQVVKLVTRFINDVVFKKDNRGELLLNDWAFDGLVQKVGIVMWWWEERYESKDEVLEGITPEQLMILVPQIEAQGAEIVEHSEQQVMAQTPMGVVASTVHSLKVRTKVNKSKCCIDTIVPEEFVISRDARTLEGATFRGHTTGAMVGDLLAAGYDPAAIEELQTYIASDQYGALKYNQGLVKDPGRQSAIDPMLRKVRITRGILKCDADGTGIKEWYVVAGGEINSPKLLEIAPYNDQIGFADFCPEPMPHQFYGRCPADRLAGIQKIQTVLVRQANDNLFLSNTPQREVVMDWIVKPDQLMNMSPGAPVLVKQPGAIREIAVPFVADKALAMMQYYDSQAEITTGVSRNTAGLDPEQLSNQSAAAANNLQSNQQGRIEMYARIWAQGGMRKLFRGVFKCIKAYQDFARIEQIDGAPQQIDPRTWDGLDELDVNINTGLGTGNRERDFAMLTQIQIEQEKIITQFGQQNPIVDLPRYVRTLQLKAESAGISYPENFFGDPIVNGQPWVFQPPPPQPSPDTQLNAQSFVQVENIKAQTRLMEKQAEIQSDERKAVADIASKERIAYRQQDIDAAVATGELQVKHATVLVRAAEVDAENIRSDMEAEKADAD